MVTIKTSADPRQGVAGKEQSLARLLKQGRVLPVISDDRLVDLALGGHQSIVAGYAKNVGYHLPDRDQLVRAETRGGDAWIELVHDRFVEPIRANNAAWFPLHLSALQRQAALWDEQGRSSGLLLILGAAGLSGLRNSTMRRTLVVIRHRLVSTRPKGTVPTALPTWLATCGNGRAVRSGTTPMMQTMAEGTCQII